MSSPLRIGVAGLGKMGLLHAAIFNQIPGATLAAVAEPSNLIRNTIAQYNPAIAAFASLDDMLAGATLNAVVIATPVAHHVPMALQCVQHHLPVFIEKPLAISAAQAAPLLDALRKQPVPHMIGFMTRYIDSFAKVHEIIRSGCLGPLQRITGTIYVSQLFQTGKGWRYDRSVSGGGVLLSQGSHLLDLLTWYCGPVARVNCATITAYNPGIEDFAHVMIEFQSGLRGWMDCSWSVRDKRTVQTTIEVLGANGVLTVTDDTLRLALDKPLGGWPAGRTSFNAAQLYRGVPFDVGGPQYTREDEAFITALRDPTTPIPDLIQACHVQHIVDAAYRSAENNGSPCEVPVP